jgi:hypothetical protein
MKARLTEVTYYRWAGALPILAPVLAYLAYQDEPTISLLDRVAIPLYVSGLVAGPAYVPFAAVLFWWIRKEPAARYRALSWIAPLLFVPPFLLYLSVARWWTGSTGPLADALVFYGVLVVLVGYGYVVLIHVGRRALVGWGAIGATSAGH